ncbi:FecR family protein [Flavicella sp.]|uniref:FecR family protein n=1 Tax=Flavicella sp. TaxID=2957742 RepID=UPI003017C5A6
MNIKTRNTIFRFFEKTLKKEEIEDLKNKLETSKKNRQLFDEYNETYQSSDMYGFNSHIDSRWEELSKKLDFKRKEKSIIKIQTVRIWQFAAVIAFLISLILVEKHIFNPHENAIVSVMTQRGQKSQVLLVDGSKVWLSSESKLTNNQGFNINHRSLSLQGKAYFQVEKKSKSPFTVDLGDVKIIVYGTRFNICSYPDDEYITASLEEGSIAFSISGIGKSILMKPGQQIVYSKKTDKITIRNVNIDLYTSWKENKLRFSNASFSDVIKKMERWYDVDIKVDPLFKYTEKFTMTIKTESLKEMMEILQKVSNINYKIEDATVYIYRKEGTVK